MRLGVRPTGGMLFAGEAAVDALGALWEARTPLAARVRWLVEHLDAGGTGGGNPDVTEVCSLLELDERAWQATLRSLVDDVVQVTCYDELAPTLAHLGVETTAGPAFIRVAVRTDGQHLVRHLDLSRLPAPGVTIRDATEDDGAALADLERRCPVLAGDVATTYDRGDDYFAQQRLMGDHLTSVAVHDGTIVGVFSESVRELRVGGREILSSYRFHLRIDPAARGLGLFPALNSHQLDRKLLRYERFAVASAFIAADNEAMLSTIDERVRARLWGVAAERLVIDCAANAGDTGLGRQASEHDAARVAHLLSCMHAQEELAPTFDEGFVLTRCTRSAADYGFTNLLLVDDAVAGVWDQRLRVERRQGTESTTSTRALVIDFACEPGHEESLVDLLRSWCARLHSTGTTHLVLLTSETSPYRRVLDRLSPQVDRFLVSVNASRPRDVDLQVNGIYVDPIWF